MKVILSSRESARSEHSGRRIKGLVSGKLGRLLSTVGVTPGTDQSSAREKRREEEFLERWVPYEEHVRELAVLKLLGRPYTPEDYLAALERRLKVRIEIKEVYKASVDCAGHDALLTGDSYRRNLRPGAP